MKSHRFTALAVLSLLTSCEVTQLDSIAGRHVVIHWDSKDGPPPCSGTVEHIDATLEVVAQTYGIDLPDEPNTDIFWTGDEELISSACRIETGACTSTLPNGTHLMFTNDPTDRHELTHTIDLAKTKLSLPSLFEEGVATRWESVGPGGPFGTDTTFYRGDLTYSDILNLLGRARIPGEAYWAAGFLWAWLEAEYGPHTMKEFAGRIDMFSSIPKIEREFEATFGVTLEEAVESSRGQPQMIFDSPACAMTHLPNLVWTGAPLVLSTGPSTCAANDVVVGFEGAQRWVRLELGDVWRPYSLEVTGSDPESDVYFFACTGEPVPYEDPTSFYPKGSDWAVGFRGTYIVVVTTFPDDDGNVQFPTVVLKPVRSISQ